MKGEQNEEEEKGGLEETQEENVCCKSVSTL